MTPITWQAIISTTDSFFGTIGSVSAKLLTSTTSILADAASETTSILPDNMCITGLLLLVLKIFVYGLGAAAIIGVTIAGIQYMTARDNQAQVANAKKRLIDVTIGIAAWAVMWAIMNWLVPGGMVDLAQGTTEVCPNVALNLPDKVDTSTVDHGSAFGNANNGSSGGSSGSSSSSTSTYKNQHATGTYTNPRNGLTFQLYEQRDPEWASLPETKSDGTPTTVGAYGCNIIASAAIVSAFDPTLTPTELYNKGHGGFVSHYVNWLGLSDKVSCTTSYGVGSCQWECVKEALNKGAMVFFTSEGHYISLLDIKDNSQVFIGNSYNGGVSARHKTGFQDINKLGKTLKDVNICYAK